MAVIEENWNYCVGDLKFSSDFEIRINALQRDLVQLNGFSLFRSDYQSISQSHDKELKILVDKNKHLRNEIDKKLEELSKQQTQYENYKQDQKLLSEEVKNIHEAFLMVKKQYKKYMKMYYTIESKNSDRQTIYLQFFTEAKKEAESYSVRLNRYTKSGQYELLETNPNLEMLEKLKITLQETNDIPGLLSSIRQAFLKVKKTKKS